MNHLTYEYIIDDFHKETWRYWFNDSRLRLVLDRCQLQERKTKRHGWKVIKHWDRIDQRQNTLKHEDIPQRDDVHAEVLRRFVGQITIE